jgi:hypothetical protein
MDLLKLGFSDLNLSNRRERPLTIN